MPYRQRKPAAEYDTPEAAAEREKARAAMDRRFARAAEEREAFAGTRPTPTGRRRSSIPVIEISRAASKDDAMAGLDRWRARWPKAAAALEPADVLVDSMRGRSTTWTRIRVNLSHVPEAERPPQEPLDPDYDPWTEWEGPDRSGVQERPARKRAKTPPGEPA